MSESSLSPTTPPDATLENALRNAVQLVYKSGNLENLTVKRIRNTVEKGLALQNEFFKYDSEWKNKSKDVIQSEVEAHSEQENASSQPTPKKSQPPSRKPQEKTRKVQGQKRASAEEGGPKKRRKNDAFSRKDSRSVEESSNKQDGNKSKARKRSPYLNGSQPGSEVEEREHDSIVPNGCTVSNGAGTDRSESDLSELIDESPKLRRSSKAGLGNAKKKKIIKPAKSAENPASSMRPDTKEADGSESEMSELIDEAPKAKRNRKSGSTEPETKKTKGAKAKKTSEELLDPDLDEIKKLQGWLVKCGIRKMWFKELAPYDTSKAKIKHLKRMLADAGMTGRYSDGKAEQIKEERELKADLEAVQEGEKMWGQAAVEEEVTGRPKRRLAKGLQELDFLNDEDGEETD